MPSTAGDCIRLPSHSNAQSAITSRLHKLPEKPTPKNLPKNGSDAQLVLGKLNDKSCTIQPDKDSSVSLKDNLLFRRPVRRVPAKLLQDDALALLSERGQQSLACSERPCRVSGWYCALHSVAHTVHWTLCNLPVATHNSERTFYIFSLSKFLFLLFSKNSKKRPKSLASV